MLILYLDSVPSCEKFKGCDEKQVEQIAMKWFHNSKDRSGGRYKRRNKATTDTATAPSTSEQDTSCKN
jgi:hypothetical protein